MKEKPEAYSELEQWMFDGGYTRRQISVMTHCGQGFGYNSSQYFDKMSDPYKSLLVRDIDVIASAMNVTCYEVLMRILAFRKDVEVSEKKLKAMLKMKLPPKELQAMLLRDGITPEKIKDRQ